MPIEKAVHIWAKTRIAQEGSHLVARTYLAADGNPTLLTTRVNLRAIEKALKNRDHVGLFGINFKKVARSKLLRKVSRNVKRVARTTHKYSKAVVRSPITGAVLAGTAVVFPPAGGPALAAYAAANAYLTAAEAAEKKIKDITKRNKTLRSVSSKLKRLVGLQPGRKRGKPTRKRLTRGRKRIASRKLKLSLSKLKKLQAYRAKLKSKQFRDKQNLRKALAKSKAAKRKIESIKRKALGGNRTARKEFAILQAVAAERARIKALADASNGGSLGLLIDSRGRITQGRFVRRPGTRGTLYTGHGQTLGEFSRV